ncbi:hypothetical protein QBC38DRAFT_492792 [Podospora fimiseda]|uniref:Uncharacterized protein n=1 Tax=Podospora fimiseda TaxID=252190 RepID=A0AAN6YKP6_9PEZI|nr:hypothetical protein QBC38DRAFT_492792 [Podospora fimiseda]
MQRRMPRMGTATSFNLGVYKLPVPTPPLNSQLTIKTLKTTTMCLRISLHFTCHQKGCRSQGRSTVDFVHVRRCEDYPEVTTACMAKRLQLPQHKFLPISCWDHLLPEIHDVRREWVEAVVTFERTKGIPKFDEVDRETRRYVSEYGASRLACLYHHWLTVVRYYAIFGPNTKDNVAFPKCSLSDEYCSQMRTAIEIWQSDNPQVGTVSGIPEGSFEELQSPAFKRFFCHWRTHGPNKNEQYPAGTVDFPLYPGDPMYQIGVGGQTWGKHFKSFEFPRGPAAPLSGVVHRYFAHLDRKYSDYGSYGILQPSSWYGEHQWSDCQRRD